MTTVTSEIVEMEVFVTSDEEVFLDDDSALEHQKYLDAKEYMWGEISEPLTIIPHEIVENGYYYIKELIKEIESEKDPL